MTKTTARMVCQYVTDHGDTQDGDGCNLTVQMDAISDGHPANNDYSKWTPRGSFQISVTNPALRGFFKPREVYDFVITRHEKLEANNSVYLADRLDDILAEFLKDLDPANGDKAKKLLLLGLAFLTSQSEMVEALLRVREKLD